MYTLTLLSDANVCSYDCDLMFLDLEDLWDFIGTESY
jgi:hypothetical protein